MSLLNRCALALAAGILSLATIMPLVAADTTPTTYTINPDHAYRGKKMGLTIMVTGCPGSGGQLTTDVTATAPAGSGMILSGFQLSQDHCSLAFSVDTDESATLGQTTIGLQQNGKILSSLAVTVADEPGVDVMWSVVPGKIMADNFGHYLSRKYHALELMIGNHSGYDLLISGVGFSPELAGCDFHVTLPSTSYKLARGSLEKAQQVGGRAIFIGIVKALGPIGTGFIPFFHALGPKANFSTGVDIFSNPLEKGLEAVIPDTTVNELQRLDDQYLREGTVIHNSDQPRYRIFVPKKFIEQLIAKLNATADSKKQLDPKSEIDIALALNKLVLVGCTVQYGPRIHIGTESSTPNATAPSKPATQNPTPAPAPK
jgi:hypothetical protein